MRLTIGRVDGGGNPNTRDGRLLRGCRFSASVSVKPVGGEPELYVLTGVTERSERRLVKRVTRLLAKWAAARGVEIAEAEVEIIPTGRTVTGPVRALLD